MSSGKSREKGRIYQATQLKCQAKGNENRALAVQELRKWRDGLARDERRRCEAEATSARTPTARYAYEFVNGKERLGLTKPSTTRGYRKIINQFCATELGLKPIDKVTTEDIRVWEAALLEVSTSSVTPSATRWSPTCSTRSPEGRVVGSEKDERSGRRISAGGAHMDASLRKPF